MTTHVRPRRLVRVAAIVAAIALTASGCGGSDVGQAQAAPDAVAAQSGADSGAPAAVADAPGTAPGAVSAPGAATQVADPSVAAPTDDKSTGKDAAAPASTGDKATAKDAGASTAADKATGKSAVEKYMATMPIFGGKAACKPATLSEIPIGNVSTLSGVLGEVLGPSRGALQIFAASQNACGGLNGHKIKLYIEDDQGDPTTASARAQGLIEKKHVLAFIGNTEVLTVDATVPVIKKYGIPVIGGDLTSNTWFTNPLFFPQGSGGQSVAYGYLVGAVQYHKKKVLGDIWCIEVPRACQQVDKAFVELAPSFGAKVVKAIQASLTAPSYVQQCLDFKASKVEVLAMTFDAASQNRVARSCEQVGYFPKVVAYPLAVGNEKQFLGNKWLGDTYIPMNHFPWMDESTPVTKYYQAQVRKYAPGFITGGAASLAWNAGALLVAASSMLTAENPTTAQILQGLYQFKGQKFTELGGLTGPLTFNEGGNPKIPYCLFGAISNKENTGWATIISKPTCTDVTAPSDPQRLKG